MKNKDLKKWGLVSALTLYMGHTGMAQVTSATNTYTAGDYLGWDGSSGLNQLQIMTAGTPRIYINGSGNGFVGIGQVAPGFRLDAKNDINITSTTNPLINEGYRINGNLVVYLPKDNTGGNNTFLGRSGNTSANPGNNNTFVGFGSGAGSAAGSLNNTFVGVNTGNLNVGTANTFMGFHSGVNNFFGDANTFTGTESGFNNTDGAGNAFFGHRAGYFNVDGSLNVFMGSSAGLNNASGDENIAIGRLSLNGNATGNRNIAIGYLSGAALGAVNNNILIGNNSNISGTVNNGTAIGNNAVVTTSNTMILGNNLNVGIGLSGISPGPQDLLEINSGTSCTSGLQFRQLNAGCTPGSNPGTGVLALDPNGKVIYVNDASSSCCLGNACGSGANLLPSDWEIPLNGNDFHFDDVAGTGVGSVSIGDPNCSSTLNARLDVINTTGSKTVAGYFSNNFTSVGNMMGIQSLATNTGGAGGAIGISSNGTNTGAGPAGGVQATALSAGGSCTGVQGTAQGGATNGGTAAIGVNGNSVVNTSNLNIGLGSVTRNGLTQSIGVRVNTLGSTSPSNQGLQVNLTGGTTAGSFNWGGIYTVSNTGITNYGAQLIVSGASATNYGSTALVSGGASLNYGQYGQAQGAIVANYGMFGQAVSASPSNFGGCFIADNATLTNYGVSGQATSTVATGVNIGGYFVGLNSAVNNYGVYASVGGFSNPTPPYGPDFAGFFDGDVVTTAGNILPSDRRLKKDIKNIENSIDIIGRLRPVTYNFDQENHKDLTLTHRKQYGFISQEVKEILPDLTTPVVFPATYDSAGTELRAKQEYLGLNYDGFIAILTKGMQEQQQVIEEQKALIEKQEERLSRLEKLLGQAPEDHTRNIHNIELADKNTVVLNQNVPNPFAESTVISYVIPETAGFAQVLFYNASGQLIKTIDIKEKGKGTLNVFASDLSAGVYTYTLVIDGKIVDTKKMNKQ